MPKIKKEKSISPFVLLILDGWGLAPPNKGNAITQAKTPFIDKLWQNYPHTTLHAHGQYVGLSDEQDGNSEAGHMNLGAGRKVIQDAVYISKSIKDGTFFKNTAFIEAVKHLKKYNTSLHILGLLSGLNSPHSSQDHLSALLELSRKEEIKKIFLHLFTDGRDSSQHSALSFLKELRKELLENEKIASISGRFYAMDRKKAWMRTEKVYNTLVLGEGEKSSSAEEIILRAYNRGFTDEFIPPTVITQGNRPRGIISDNDVIIFFNLRSDRARQLTKAFVQDDFNRLNPLSFKRKKRPKNIRFVAMTDFGPDLPYVLTAFPSRDLKGTLPLVLSDLRQLYMAETEKYAHVTYFFNGGYASPIGGEKRILIKSPEVLSYDLKPEMSIKEITQVVVDNIKNNIYDFICVNFANPDMVGHTGNLEAGIKAVEWVDKCTGEVIKESLKKNGIVVITADHGNIEEMINLETGEVDTKHSVNPVPFMVVGSNPKIKNLKLKEEGILGDVAATILDLMDRKKPKEMAGRSLVI